MPPPTVPDACNNCLYYLKIDKKIGRCRRYPPIYLDIAVGKRKAVFPFVTANAWCGKYEKNNNAEK